jgi:hypothetical protein
MNKKTKVVVSISLFAAVLWILDPRLLHGQIHSIVWNITSRLGFGLSSLVVLFMMHLIRNTCIMLLLAAILDHHKVLKFEIIRYWNMLYEHPSDFMGRSSREYAWAYSGANHQWDSSSKSETDNRRSWWEILDVHPSASNEAIKTAYRKKAKATHPDVAPGNEAAFRELNEAYETVCKARAMS